MEGLVKTGTRRPSPYVKYLGTVKSRYFAPEYLEVSGKSRIFVGKYLSTNIRVMKRFLSIVCLSVCTIGTALAQSGYPYTQVPFTAVKITPNTFWGDRIQAAREVTIPLAFSKCESEHRYKNFEMAA